MRHRVTCEARHLPTADVPSRRLLAIEGVKFDPPLPVEHITRSTWDSADPEQACLDLSVWHGAQWMFGLTLSLDDVIEWDYIGPDDEYLNIPKPPNRTGLIRVHGTWMEPGSPHDFTGGVGYPPPASPA